MFAQLDFALRRLLFSGLKYECGKPLQTLWTAFSLGFISTLSFLLNFWFLCICTSLLSFLQIKLFGRSTHTASKFAHLSYINNCLKVSITHLCHPCSSHYTAKQMQNCMKSTSVTTAAIHYEWCHMPQLKVPCPAFRSFDPATLSVP